MLFSSSISKFIGILIFQFMLTVAKRMVNFVLNLLTGAQRTNKRKLESYSFAVV